MNKRAFFAVGALAILLFAFQNCGLSKSSHTDLNSLGKTCLATAERAFRDTYYPHVRSQCSQCHDAGGEGISWFANSDPQFAFSAFMNTTREKLNAMMVYDGHPGPNNGANQQPFVASMSAQWDLLDKQIDDCVNATAVTTVPKNNSVQDVNVNDNNDTNRRPWKTLEYDLFSDMALAQNNSAIKMVVRIQYRESGPGVVRAGAANRAGLACLNNTPAADCVYVSDIGYEFRNPVARIRAGAETGTQYSVDKLIVLMNGRRLGTVTSFEAIKDMVVGSATDTPLIESATSPGVTAKTPGSDTFALRFAEIRDANGRTVGGGTTPGGGGGTPLPNTISYIELANNANTYGYFARRCFQCHGVGGAGGLDLTNYTQAAARANTIKSRVNDPMRPMPPAGLLPQYDRDVISKWVDTGARQN